jgi:hypothetical protein
MRKEWGFSGQQLRPRLIGRLNLTAAPWELGRGKLLPGVSA